MFADSGPPLLVIAVSLVLGLGRFLINRRSMRRLVAFDAAAVTALLLVTAVVERQMGRPLTYLHGPVRLWSGDIMSDQNSQQIADPYTLTHVTHGAWFYGLTHLMAPGASAGLRLVAAIGIEGAWEAYENTDTVIQRYRSVTISLGYYGDSVLNSAFDIVACLLGFLLTSRLPRWATLGWVVVAEVVLALWIRDNLSLNILMLVYPLDAVRAWQAGV